VDKTIGERIRRIRAGKGYSQANVAEDLGITTGAYSKIERGDTDANVSRLLHIAQVLEVHICEFFRRRLFEPGDGGEKRIRLCDEGRSRKSQQKYPGVAAGIYKAESRIERERKTCEEEKIISL
jgi:transcriptional regulator with XRE-family HTH domain